MNVTELTKEIHEKHPNVWHKLSRYVKVNYHEELEVCADIEDHEKEIIFVYNFDLDTRFIFDIPFAMLYGLLDEFFRSYDIWMIQHLDALLRNYLLLHSNKLAKEYNVYEKFQIDAILKASEILEDKL